MNKYNKKTFIFLINIVLLFINSACTNTTSTKKTESVNEAQYHGKENAVSVFSEEKKYRVTLYSNSSPIKTGKIHNWTLKVLTPDGDELDKVKIYLHGGMPQHRHGFPTRPRIAKMSGKGLYLVSGVKFSMPGAWEMRFNIKEKTKRDRVVFKINL